MKASFLGNKLQSTRKKPLKIDKKTWREEQQNGTAKKYGLTCSSRFREEVEYQSSTNRVVASKKKNREAAREWRDKMDKMVQDKFDMHMQNLPSPKHPNNWRARKGAPMKLEKTSMQLLWLSWKKLHNGSRHTIPTKWQKLH